MQYKVDNIPQGAAGMAWVADQVRITRPELETLPRVTASFHVYSKIRACIRYDKEKCDDKELLALIGQCDAKIRQLREEWEPSEHHEGGFEVTNTYLQLVDDFDFLLDDLITASKYYDRAKVDSFKVPDRIKKKQAES